MSFQSTHRKPRKEPGLTAECGFWWREVALGVAGREEVGSDKPGGSLTAAALEGEPGIHQTQRGQSGLVWM